MELAKDVGFGFHFRPMPTIQATTTTGRRKGKSIPTREERQDKEYEGEGRSKVEGI